MRAILFDSSMSDLVGWVANVLSGKMKRQLPAEASKLIELQDLSEF
jgi:hypothetical protein